MATETEIRALPWRGMFTQAAKGAGIPESLLLAVAEVESDYDPNAISPAGARGMMQVMPATAEEIAGEMGLGSYVWKDPWTSIKMGAHYLAKMRRLVKDLPDPDRLMVAAYNAGAGSVQKYGGIPPFAETQEYVEKVAAAQKRWEKTLAGPVKEVPPGYFPLKGFSLSRLQSQGYNGAWKFGAPRDGGARSHAGLDLYGTLGEPVFAIRPGIVSWTGPFYNGTLGLTIAPFAEPDVEDEYGEVMDGSILVKVGDRVTAGQRIAALGDTHTGMPAMLHFERHQGNTAELAAGQKKEDPTAFITSLWSLEAPQPAPSPESGPLRLEIWVHGGKATAKIGGELGEILDLHQEIAVKGGTQQWPITMKDSIPATPAHATNATVSYSPPEVPAASVPPADAKPAPSTPTSASTVMGRKPWWKSRKVWMAAVSGAVLFLNSAFDLRLDSETVLGIAGVAIAYILGESAIDMKTAMPGTCLKPKTAPGASVESREG